MSDDNLTQAAPGITGIFSDTQVDALWSSKPGDIDFFVSMLETFEDLKTNSLPLVGRLPRSVFGDYEPKVADLINIASEDFMVASVTLDHVLLFKREPTVSLDLQVIVRSIETSARPQWLRLSEIAP